MVRVRMFLCSALAALSVSVVTVHAEETTTDGFNVTQSVTGVGEPKLVFLDTRHQPPLPIGDFRLGVPCSCSDVSCGCCVGMRVEALGFDRNACMNLTYVPNNLTMESNFFMDEESLYRASIAVRNPPPLCIPIPVPFLPVLDMCARFSKVYTKGANLHVCLKLEARLQTNPLVVMQFDCMWMGYDGVSLSRPGGSLTLG